MQESGSTLANSLSFPAVFQKGRSPDCLIIPRLSVGYSPLARLGGLWRLPAALCRQLILTSFCSGPSRALSFAGMIGRNSEEAPCLRRAVLETERVLKDDVPVNPALTSREFEYYEGGYPKLPACVD